MGLSSGDAESDRGRQWRRSRATGGSLFLSHLNEPEMEGVEDKLGTLSGAYEQTPPVWPRASEGTGLVLNVTEARGLHSGGPRLCTPPSPSSRRSWGSCAFLWELAALQSQGLAG